MNEADRESEFKAALKAAFEGSSNNAVQQFARIIDFPGDLCGKAFKILFAGKYPTADYHREICQTFNNSSEINRIEKAYGVRTQVFREYLVKAVEEGNITTEQSDEFSATFAGVNRRQVYETVVIAHGIFSSLFPRE